MGHRCPAVDGLSRGGLAIHGIGYAIGGLAEPITYKRLLAPNEEPLQTAVVIGNFVWPVLIAITAINALE